jgi:hypothetical protein
MIHTLLRKTGQVVGDPVLRQWLWRRVTGAAAKPPSFTVHHPPYLNGMAMPLGVDAAPPEAFKPLSATPPVGQVELPLPGLLLRLDVEGARDIFQRDYGDVETLLALHRFAWVPLITNTSAERASWVQAIWDIWRRDFAVSGAGWAWHPYTAAERAINLLDLARSDGLPEPVEETVLLLTRHAYAIRERLEYFGDHNTSNHLSNNGRGLYRLGLALGIEWAAEQGARILEQEAQRILLESGMLREGSSHYHLLIARNYADAWLAARRHGRPEEPTLRALARKVLAVIPNLILPGGLPLVGDVSPDCPPEHLLGLAGAETGWVAALPDDDRAALMALTTETGPTPKRTLSDDGWLRFGHGPWSGLWYASPAGWSHAPGHGHQDAGAFELHYQDLPVFIDPGRGGYGETRDAARYRSAAVHNTVTVGGADPYPPNKPYYDDAFRHAIAGPSPVIKTVHDDITLEHSGFQRIDETGKLRRQWRFTESEMVLTDELAGQGSCQVSRRFVTPLEVEAEPTGIGLSGAGKSFHLSSRDAEATISEITLWSAYGRGRPGKLIEFAAESPLPWSGEICLRAR